MGDVPISLHVNAALKTDLEREARLLNVSESEIAERALGQYLSLQDHKRDVLAAAAAAAEDGAFISGEAMHAWIESWGTDKELPLPEPDIFLPSKA